MSAGMNNEIINAIEKRQDEMFSLVQDIVRIPSICGNEGAAQKWVEGKYRDLGLETVLLQAERETIQDHPSFIESSMPYEGRPNVIGILKGDPGEKSLVLNGHIDVVSPEPVSAWKYDPWGGEIKEGKLWGRGSADMKGGLIANFFALKTLLDLGIKPRGTVQLHSVVEEEAGGAPGTLACLLGGYRADGFLASEPHALGVTISHAGILYYKITVIGKTSHAGLAHLGVNAISKMYPIFQAMVDLDEKRGRDVQFDLYFKGSGRSTHLNIGKLVAGDWPSTVAGWAELQCRISFIPGETEEGIKNLIAETVQEVVNKDEWLRQHPPSLEWFGWHADPWYQDPEAPYVKSFVKTASRVMSSPAEIIGRASGNDARFTQYFPDTTGICFGPKGENIHGIDECVDLDSLVTTAKVLAVHIADWCGVEK